MEILVPLAFFAMIAAIVIAPSYLRSLERQKQQEILKAAIEKGQSLPPELIAAMSSDTRKPAPSPERDLRRGIVWLGVAVGLAAFGWVLGFSEPDATYPLLAISAFPGFIGLAFIVISFLGRSR